MLIKGAIACFSVMLASGAVAQNGFVEPKALEKDVLEGVTFDKQEGAVYVPIRMLGKAAKLYVGWEPVGQEITLDEAPVEDEHLEKLFDGSNLLHVRALEDHGFEVNFDPQTEMIDVSNGDIEFLVVIPEKKTEINLKEQKLIAWQGSTVVMETKISSGRRGYSTPTGEFTAGPEKSRYRRSRKYNNSPMPYSVQLRGGYFVHGYTSVPNYPASHGCIRMPLYGNNAAKYFFEWVDKGSPITIRYEWSEEVTALLGEGELDASSD